MCRRVGKHIDAIVGVILLGVGGVKFLLLLLLLICAKCTVMAPTAVLQRRGRDLAVVEGLEEAREHVAGEAVLHLTGGCRASVGVHWVRGGCGPGAWKLLSPSGRYHRHIACLGTKVHILLTWGCVARRGGTTCCPSNGIVNARVRGRLMRG